MFRLAGFLHGLLSVFAVLGLSVLAVLEQVPNVVSHVICQHGRVSRLRALQCKAWSGASGVQIQFFSSFFLFPHRKFFGQKFRTPGILLNELNLHITKGPGC